jgi:hypothetical protein
MGMIANAGVRRWNYIYRFLTVQAVGCATVGLERLGQSTAAL